MTKTKEIPLSFTKENRALVRADLKTETRRIAKPKYHCPGTYIEHLPGDKYPWYCRDRYGMMDSFRSADELADKCSPYGGKGKTFRYYMKEPVQVLSLHEGDIASGPWAEIIYPDTPDDAPVSVQISGQDYQKLLSRKDWRKPSTGMFMLKSFARTWLKRERLWVEKLGDMSEESCLAECVPRLLGAEVEDGLLFFNGRPIPDWASDLDNGHPLIDGYASLWNSINGAGSWNPEKWVWCVKYSKEEQS